MSEARDYDFNQHDHSKPRKGSVEERDPASIPKSAVLRSYDSFFNMIDKPVTWFRETFVTPNQTTYPWYHEKFRRVPTIDKCFTDDFLCIYEADIQYRKDRNVDSQIITILRYRMDDCVREEYPDYEKCFPFKEAYEAASANWFSKYGDLGAIHHVTHAYMKQKHRMLWERRNGKIGCGKRKNPDNELSAETEDH